MALKINVNEPAHLDIRIDGETHSVDLATGENWVHDDMARLLITQGIATPAVDEPKTTASARPARKTTPKDTPTETPEA